MTAPARAMEITVAVEGELHMELPSLLIGAGPPLRDLAKALFARLNQTSDPQRQAMRHQIFTKPIRRWLCKLPSPGNPTGR